MESELQTLLSKYNTIDNKINQTLTLLGELKLEKDKLSHSILYMKHKIDMDEEKNGKKLLKTRYIHDIKDIPNIDSMFGGYKVKDTCICKWFINKDYLPWETCISKSSILIEFYEEPMDLKCEYKISDAKMTCKNKRDILSKQKEEGIRKIKEKYPGDYMCCVCENNLYIKNSNYVYGFGTCCPNYKPECLKTLIKEFKKHRVPIYDTCHNC